MSASSVIRSGTPQPCHPWPRYSLAAPAWAAMVEALPAEPTLALQALWPDSAAIHALFLDEATSDVLFVSTGFDSGAWRALSPVRPAAAWMERAIHDLWGRRAEGSTDARPWLDHGRWGVTAPLAPRPTPIATPTPPPPEFLPVEGEDLLQIPLGPIHAGIAEPAHYRIAAAGEAILRLEARLGYAHKGTLALMRGKSPRAAARYAARLAGDATVAHSIAFARAAEAAVATEPPPRAVALRAVMAELERIAIHLGDAGAICEEAGLPEPAARFALLRETIVAVARIAFASRLMMDAVIPGGIAANIDPHGPAAIARALDALDAGLPALARLPETVPGFADRLDGAGIVPAALLRQFAPGGIVGRAAGRAFDARRSPGYPPYDTLDLDIPIRPEGDAAARFGLRLIEIATSLRLLRRLLDALPEGPVAIPLPMATGEGIGIAETPRGEAWHWLRLDGGLIATAFMRDPAWLHWPLLEAASAGAALSDLPLIAASFGLACSGVDL